MTTLVRARTRALLGMLGLALASACDNSTPRDAAKAEAPSTTKPTRAEQPEGLGLEDGQRWRLELDGEAPLAGRYGGESVEAKRREFDLTLSMQGEAVDLVITLEQVPMGQTGRFPATPARFHASTPDVDCSTAMGGAVRVNLTHNEVDRVAGRIEGETECKTPEGSKTRWSGAFDYSGTIEFK